MVEIMQKVKIDPRDIQKRLTRGRKEAKRIISAMKRMGVEVELIGSMKTGDVRPHSDIDLLVTDSGSIDNDLVLHEIMLLECDIPIDVVFQNMLPSEALPKFRKALD